MFDHAVYFSFYNGAVVESAHWRAHECWIVWYWQTIIIQIINFSDDACKLWQYLCQSCSVQLVYSADAMWWYEAICAFWEGKTESSRRTRAVCKITPHRKFSNYFISYLIKEIWIVPHLQHYNYFAHAGQSLRLCRCMSCQTSDGRQLEISLWEQLLIRH